MQMFIMQMVTYVCCRYKLASGFWLTDVHVRDKQNVNAAKHILHKNVRICQREHDNESTLGLQTYLAISEKIILAFEN